MEGERLRTLQDQVNDMNDCISARTGKRGLGGFPGARVCSSIPKMCSGSHLQLRVQQKTTAMSHS